MYQSKKLRDFIETAKENPELKGKSLVSHIVFVPGQTLPVELIDIFMGPDDFAVEKGFAALIRRTENVCDDNDWKIVEVEREQASNNYMIFTVTLSSRVRYQLNFVELA